MKHPTNKAERQQARKVNIEHTKTLLKKNIRSFQELLDELEKKETLHDFD